MQNRINNIIEYFRGFNIADGIAYIHVTFPKTWQLPNNNILNNEFKTSVASDNTGIYFFTKYENGINIVFDAVEFTIDFNKDLEEKTSLFKDKVSELKELFMQEKLDVLKTLQFKLNKKKTAKKKNPNQDLDKNVEEQCVSKETTISENNDSESLLNFAQNIVKENNN